MALTITIDSTDRTSLIPLLGGIYGLTAFQEQEDASSFSSACTIPVVVLSGSGITFAEKQTVLVEDGATTIWAGYIANIDAMPVGVDTIAYTLHCQDKNILLEETAVPSASYASQADSAVIDDLFTTYLSSIDSTTYVSTIDATMEAIAFDGKALRQCLTMICNLTGGMFYVDFEDNLHYFDSSESNAAAWDLSDSPDYASTFPVENLRKHVDGSVIVDKVYVIGTNVEGWVGSGEHEAIVWDPNVTTAQGVTDRGAAIIARYENGQTTYTCTIRKSGLVAGMDIDLTNSLLGLSAETLTIRRLTMTCTSADGAEREYQLELGDVLFTPAAGSRFVGDVVDNNSENGGSVADDVYDTDAPSAPALEAGNLSTGVDVDADGHQIVYLQVTWGSVADTDLDHYQVQVSTSSDFSGYTMTRNHPKDGDRIERFIVIGNTTYYVRVRAEDWVGNDSAWSSTQSKTTSADSTPPAQVTGLTVTGARTLLGLIWDANSEADLSYYEIQRDDDDGGSPAGSWATVAQAKLNFYIDENHSEADIQASTVYHYRVRAVDTSGNQGDWSTSDSDNLDPLGSDSIAANAIIANHIGSNEIITYAANIQDAVITSAKIENLDGIVITGNTIRTAASGARVVLDSTDGIRLFNSTPTLTAQFDVDGSGQIGASGLNPLTWNSAGQLDQINANQITLGVGGNNVLTNSAFLYDDDADDIPDDWSESKTVSNYTLDLDTAEYVIGGQALEIEITAGNTDGEHYTIQQNVDISELGLAPGDDFVLSGYVKSDSLSDVEVRLRVVWYDVTPSSLQTDVAAFLDTDVDWTRYSTTNTIPANAVTARVQCRVTLADDNGTGSAFFDGIQLERGDTATDWKPGLLGNVTIDGSRIEVLDSGGGRVIVGKRGTDFGMFGEDSGGDLQVAWYANGDDAGMIVAGAGVVRLNTDGIAIEAGTGTSTTAARSYKFVQDGTTTERFRFGVYDDGSTIGVEIVPQNYSSHDCEVILAARCQSAGSATLTLESYDGTTQPQILIEAHNDLIDMLAGTIRINTGMLQLYNGADIQFEDATHYLYRSGNDIYWYNGTGGTKLN